MPFDPTRQFGHQLFFQKPRVVDLLLRGGMQPFGLVGGKAEFEEQICARPGNVADPGVDRDCCTFLTLATAR